MDRSSLAEALSTWSCEYRTAAAASAKAVVLLSFAVGGGEVSCGVGGLGVRTGAGSSCESGSSCDDGGGVVEADLTESGSARVSSVVGSNGCSMAGELLGLALGLVGLGIQVEVEVVQQAPVVGEAGASASASGRR